MLRCCSNLWGVHGCRESQVFWWGQKVLPFSKEGFIVKLIALEGKWLSQIAVSSHSILFSWLQKTKPNQTNHTEWDWGKEQRLCGISVDRTYQWIELLDIAGLFVRQLRHKLWILLVCPRSDRTVSPPAVTPGWGLAAFVLHPNYQSTVFWAC